MNALVLSFVTLLAVSSACLSPANAKAIPYTCGAAEAEFIGRVADVRMIKGQCQIRINDFRLYQESGVCALDQSVAEANWVSVKDCTHTIGSEVSGYLSATTTENVRLN